ncbi:MAG: 5'-nucleotidase C-terminal domain-containing protein [Candidatus Gastranaerophilales bacterium]
MIKPVNQIKTNLLSQAISKKLQDNSTNKNGQIQTEPTRTSIFYINDFHGKSLNMERAVSVSRVFDSFEPSQKTDKLKLSSGDIMIGEDLAYNKVAAEAQRAMGIMASTMGNHEFDTTNDINKLIPSVGYELVSCNIQINPDNPLSNRIKPSFIQEVDGNKYGIIGISPVDLLSRIKHGTVFNQLKVDDIEETIDNVQQEVKHLQSQGVNKIFLLSHVGYDYDKKIAKETNGIDVILGGHSHHMLKGVKPDVNLFKSNKDEPVVITQAGRDGNNLGILNVEFDKNGIMTKIQNNIVNTFGFRRDGVVKKVFENILGKPQVVGRINSAPMPQENVLTEPRAHANFITDCIKEMHGTDIAIVGAPTIRGYFAEGEIDTRMIEDLSPFKNKLVIAQYNEEEIVKALKTGAESEVNRYNKPGLLHVSGMTYTVSKDGKLVDLNFIDKNGDKQPIDIDNPDKNKTYRVATTDYYASGEDGFYTLNKIEEAEQIFDYDLCKCVENYFLTHKEPVDIVDDGRIKIVA